MSATGLRTNSKKATCLRTKLLLDYYYYLNRVLIDFIDFLNYFPR